MTYHYSNIISDQRKDVNINVKPQCKLNLAEGDLLHEKLLF